MFVTILTHESGRLHWEQTSAAMLTQFFLSSTSIATSVDTYVVHNELPQSVDTLHLCREQFYCKSICRGSFKKWQNSSFTESEYKPIMFIFSHGTPGDSDPYFTFTEQPTDVVVYAARRSQSRPCFHDVIAYSTFVCLLSCAGGDIVRAYLADRRLVKDPEIPDDIVYFDSLDVHHTTQAIFVAWLIHKLDAAKCLPHNPSPRELHLACRDSVCQMLHELHQCDSAKDFWEHLLDWGCLSKYTEQKARQQQPLPTHRFEPDTDFDNAYFVYGHTKLLLLGQPQQQTIFDEFRTLTLASEFADASETFTHESSFPDSFKERHARILQKNAHTRVPLEFLLTQLANTTAPSIPLTHHFE